MRTVGPCTELEIDERTVKQLNFQSPVCGFHQMELLTQWPGAMCLARDWRPPAAPRSRRCAQGPTAAYLPVLTSNWAGWP